MTRPTLTLPRMLTRVAKGLAAVVVAACVVRGGMVWNQRRTVLPDFVDVPDGARAPLTPAQAQALSGLGLTVGTSTLADVNAFIAAHQLSCRDVSMRALMAAGRDAVRAEMERVRAAGGDADAVSGASRANYYSKKERNPQIKLYCGDLKLGKVLGPEWGQSVDDAFTFVFDSADHPLRYIMIARKYQSNHETFVNWQRALSAWEPVLGPPTATSTAQPQEDPTGEAKTFPRFTPFSRSWKFADRNFEVSAMNFGPSKGIDLRLILEVPWPVTTTPSTSTSSSTSTSASSTSTSAPAATALASHP